MKINRNLLAILLFSSATAMCMEEGNTQDNPIKKRRLEELSVAPAPDVQGSALSDPNDDTGFTVITAQPTTVPLLEAQVQEKRFECPESECKYLSTRKENLKPHLQAVHKICGKCLTRFDSLDALQAHAKQTHRYAPFYEQACATCGYVSLAQTKKLCAERLQKHSKEHHAVNTEILQMDNPEQLAEKRAEKILAKMEIHEDVQCPQCGATFTLKGNMSKHLEYFHSVCATCSTQCNDLSELYAHGLQEHKKEPSFYSQICSICNAQLFGQTRTTSLNALNHHLKQSHE